MEETVQVLEHFGITFGILLIRNFSFRLRSNAMLAPGFVCRIRSISNQYGHLKNTFSFLVLFLKFSFDDILFDLSRFQLCHMCFQFSVMYMYGVCLFWSCFIHYDLFLFSTIDSRPDMTFVVDWALINNYLSIYLLLIIAIHPQRIHFFPPLIICF